MISSIFIVIYFKINKCSFSIRLISNVHFAVVNGETLNIASGPGPHVMAKLGTTVFTECAVVGDQGQSDFLYFKKVLKISFSHKCFLYEKISKIS